MRLLRIEVTVFTYETYKRETKRDEEKNTDVSRRGSLARGGGVNSAAGRTTIWGNVIIQTPI